MLLHLIALYRYSSYVTIRGAITPRPRKFFMVGCLVAHRETFTVCLNYLLFSAS